MILQMSMPWFLWFVVLLMNIQRYTGQTVIHTCNGLSLQLPSVSHVYFLHCSQRGSVSGPFLMSPAVNVVQLWYLAKIADRGHIDTAHCSSWIEFVSARLSLKQLKHTEPLTSRPSGPRTATTSPCTVSNGSGCVSLLLQRLLLRPRLEGGAAFLLHCRHAPVAFRKMLHWLHFAIVFVRQMRVTFAATRRATSTTYTFTNMDLVQPVTRSGAMKFRPSTVLLTHLVTRST